MIQFIGQFSVTMTTIDQLQHSLLLLVSQLSYFGSILIYRRTSGVLTSQICTSLDKVSGPSLLNVLVKV